MRQLALIGVVLVAAAQAHSAPVSLNEDELRAAVVGKTVKIDTPLGTPLTVQIGANGIMQGTATAALALYLGSAKDRGRWRVKDGKLCQKWFKWLDAEENCISVKQDGQKIFWRRDDGKTGTAMIEPGPPELAGATASGLGLPPPPAAPEADAALSPDPMAAVPEPPEPAARLAPLARAQVFSPRIAAVAHDLPKPLIEPRAVALEAAAEPIEPQLLEAPRVVPRRPSGSIRLAAFAPLRPIAPAEVAPAETTTAVDPFDAEAQPMRLAADLNAIAAIAHRWCLADAFGRGPAPPNDAGETLVSARIELEAVPNLLAVFYEMSYPGELPLHEAACLTAQPALLHVPELPAALR